VAGYCLLPFRILVGNFFDFEKEERKMFVITCVDSSGGNAGLGDGNESKTRIYADKTTALNEAYRWYCSIYEYLKYGYCANTEMLGRQNFIRQLTDPKGTYVVVQYDDFHIQFEYSEVGITSYLACEEQEEEKLSDGILLGATLLSVEEAKQVPEEIRKFEGWWWLRSPGLNTHCVAGVHYDGVVDGYGLDVYYDNYSVRPALQLNLESSNPVSDGTKLRVGEYDFTVVCNGEYALCDTSIGNSAFRKDWDAKDANDYEASDVKIIVDGWYKKKIVGREVRNSCSPVMKSSEIIIYPEEITGTLGRILDEADLSGDLLDEVQELYDEAVKLLNG